MKPITCTRYATPGPAECTDHHWSANQRPSTSQAGNRSGRKSSSGTSVVTRACGWKRR